MVEGSVTKNHRSEKTHLTGRKTYIQGQGKEKNKKKASIFGLGTGKKIGIFGKKKTYRTALYEKRPRPLQGEK